VGIGKVTLLCMPLGGIEKKLNLSKS